MISGVRASSIRIEFDLVDDGVDVPALDHVLQPVLHVVAQIVEAELVVGAVGDVAVVFLLALLVVEPVHDDADGQPEELVDLAHPLGVALGEIVVDGDDVHAAAGERIEIDRQAWRPASCLRRSSSRRSCPRAAPCRRRAARRNGAGRGCACRPRARWRRQAPGCRRARLAVGDLLLERLGARAQLLVGELLEFLLQRVDGGDAGLIGADAALVGRAENLAGERADHTGIPFNGRNASLPNQDGSGVPKSRNPSLSRLCPKVLIASAATSRDSGFAFGSVRQTAARQPDLHGFCGDIGVGHILVNWRQIAGFSRPHALLAPMRPLQRGTDCATVPPTWAVGGAAADPGTSL